MYFSIENGRSVVVVAGHNLNLGSSLQIDMKKIFRSNAWDVLCFKACAQNDDSRMSG